MRASWSAGSAASTLPPNAAQVSPTRTMQSAKRRVASPSSPAARSPRKTDDASEKASRAAVAAAPTSSRIARSFSWGAACTRAWSACALALSQHPAASIPVPLRSVIARRRARQSGTAPAASTARRRRPHAARATPKHPTVRHRSKPASTTSLKPMSASYLASSPHFASYASNAASMNRDRPASSLGI